MKTSTIFSKIITLTTLFFFYFTGLCLSKDLLWIGSSTNWNDSSNFSPAYVPTVLDTVTLDGTGTYEPVLSGHVTVYTLNMQDGTLDLNGYKFEVLSNSAFSGGVITSGHLIIGGTVALFSRTEFFATIHVECDVIELNGSTFYGNSYFQILGSDTNVWQGGNVFHDTVTIVHSGTGGHLSMSINTGDVFYGPLWVENQSDFNNQTRLI